jgi:hypothetical protein
MPKIGDQWRVTVNAVMNVRTPHREGNFVIISGRILPAAI